jgi:hypothetical protein
MKRIALAAAVIGGTLLLVATGALAKGGNGGHKAFLNGYQEVVGPGSISTTGHGSLALRIQDDGIHYRLRYAAIEGGAVTAAHIHFAQRHVGGGIIADLCNGNEAPCTTPNGDISGTITPAEIKGPANQGIEPGSYAEAVRAIRAGATYANVHSTRWGAGEIRGQISHGNRKGHDD